MSYRIAVLPGDGIGPEVVRAALGVLDAVSRLGGLDVQRTELLVGGAAIDAYGTPLRPEDLERCRAADAVLLGAVGGPAWDDMPVERRPERALLALRSELGLGINLRPVTWTVAGSNGSPLRPEVARDADIAFVRELTGGVYFGKPSYIERAPSGARAVDTAAYDEGQILAVLAFAFDLARARRGKVTSVDKANVMNTSRLWREIATAFGRQHPDVELEHALVDSFSMSLMQDPRRYDVVVTENLFGDILTDLASVIAGSLGVLPSASLSPRRGSLTPRRGSLTPRRGGAGRRRFGLYEPVHGSAPGIAGRGIANPAGCVLSVALMLEWSFDRPDLARLVRDAVRAVMADGILTADLAGPEGPPPATTDQFVDALVAVIHEVAKPVAGVGGRA